MKVKNKFITQIIVLYLCLICTTEVFSIYSQSYQLSTGKSANSTEMILCNDIVEKFCVAWKANHYDVMYSMIDSSGKNFIEKDKFADLYGAETDGRGKVLQFSLKKAVKSQDGIIVQVEMIFKKEKAPCLINGVHKVHLIASGNGSWKIKAIVAPISIPMKSDESGGDHPGE
ncbi:MAG: hypothetical protein JW795_11605 [Chitinivibrionales bacterium]|nr:hypothetical protein [Chitinivibrionales bacterium]